MTRVVWTNEEKRALRDCMIDICYVTPTMSNKGLLKHAQEEVLPYERRQKITDQKVFTHKAMIAGARKAAETHRAKVTAPPPKKIEIVVPVAPEPPPLKIDTLGNLFELLVDAITDRVLEKLKAAEPVSGPTDTVEKGFGAGWLDELEKLSIRSKAARVKRPTVLVVGLNGCQVDAIKTHRTDIDFTFVTAEQALSHHTFHKDHTILMTKFINHSAQGKYRKHPNLHYCNGGVSDLKHMLQVIFHKETT
jgi:hypothetical protein